MSRATLQSSTRTATSKMATKIYILYSSNSNFAELRFVKELVAQLEDYGFRDTLYFDYQAGDVDERESPLRFTARIKACEKCCCAIVIESSSMDSSVTDQLETLILQRRVELKTLRKSLVFGVRISSMRCESVKNISDYFCDISNPSYVHFNDAERCAEAFKVWHEGLRKLKKRRDTEVISIGEEEEIDTIEESHSTHVPSACDKIAMKASVKTQESFVNRPISTWSQQDVQQWLSSLTIHKKYHLNFEECAIDGSLLLTLNDEVLLNVLDVSSKVCRRKILDGMKSQQLVNSHSCSWAQLKRKTRTENVAYIISDPRDNDLVYYLRSELQLKGFKAASHPRRGHSQECFLRGSSLAISCAGHVIFLMTSHTSSSIFQLYELLCAYWLNAKCTVVALEYPGQTFRVAMEVLLAELPSVDFTRTLHEDAFRWLVESIRPASSTATLVLERKFIVESKMKIIPFKSLIDRLAMMNNDIDRDTWAIPKNRMIFLSYDWRSISRVKRVVREINNRGLTCWADELPVNSCSPNKKTEFTSTSGLVSHQGQPSFEKESQIQRSACALVFLSTEYIHNKCCLDELSLLNTYNVPMVIIVLGWLSTLPDSTPYFIRGWLAPWPRFEMGNEALFSMNLQRAVSCVYKIVETEKNSWVASTNDEPTLSVQTIDCATHLKSIRFSLPEFDRRPRL